MRTDQASSGGVRETRSWRRVWHAAEFTGSDEQRSAYLATLGGGPVTWSYFGMLLGQQDSKPDTWLQRYALQALGVTPSPESTRMLVNAAASELGVEPSRLDHAIWRYASGRRWHTARKREVCRQARILDEPTRGVDDNLCLSRRLASERLPTTPARSCGAHLAKTLEVVDRTAVVLLPALNNRAYTRSSSCPARGTSVPGANRENRVEESRLDLLGHPPGHGGSSIPMVACMCAMNEASSRLRRSPVHLAGWNGSTPRLVTPQNVRTLPSRQNAVNGMSLRSPLWLGCTGAAPLLSADYHPFEA